jgi:predicted nucleotidyltransferase
MSSEISNLAPFADVNTTLSNLLGKVKAILKNQLVGMYLYGSLATGGFTPDRSDIDFLVVTETRLSESILQALEKMHSEMIAEGSKWNLKLEGSYIPRADIRRYNPENGPYLCVNEGQIYRARHDSAMVLILHTLREKGVVVEGPKPSHLIDPIAADELKRVTVENLHEWWEPMLKDQSKLQRNDYRSYAVLTMSRILFTLRFGTLASKEEAGEWAQGVLGGQYAVLIEEALAWREGMPFDHLEETLDFIRYFQNICLDGGK